MSSIDVEINRCLPLLGKDEKKSLLGVIKSFLQLKETQPQRLTVEEYNAILDRAIAEGEAGLTTSQEELEKEAEHW